MKSDTNMSSDLADQASSISDSLNELATKLGSSKLNELASKASNLGDEIATISLSGHGSIDPLIFGITVLVLSCFIGYFVVWSVTPALHSPLMGVTNAISSVIIVGALIAAGPKDPNFFASLMGFFAIVLASINIFGGFIVTQRMLSMFKRKKPSGENK
jgi:NAD(P) transhydrogenase subunit alpha